MSRGSLTGLRLGLPGLLLRAAPTRAAVLGLLVALATAAIVLAPAWVSSRTGAALSGTVAGMGPGRLGLEFTLGSRIAAQAAEPMGGVGAAGEAIATSLPGSVASIAGPRTDLVDTEEYQAIDAPVPITRAAMRFMPDAAAMTRIVDGAAPTGTVTERQIGQLEDQDGNPMMGPSYEVAVSRETADELGLHVGDHLSLMPGANINGQGLGITVTGIFEVVDPSDPRWFDDVTMVSPVEVRASSEVTIYHMVALLADRAYPAFAPADGLGGPLLHYRWRFPVAAASAARWDVDTLSADLAGLALAHPYAGSLPTGTPGLSTGLVNVLAEDRAQRAVATTAFTLAAAGPLAAGIGVIALAASAVADRRRTTIRVLRSRGTGTRRILGAEALAALGVAMPSAAAGGLAGAAVLAASGRAVAPMAAAAAVLGATVTALVLLLLAAGPAIRGRAGAQLGRRGRRLLGPAQARVLTGLVLVVAVAAAVGLHSAARPAAGTLGPGPTLVPVLLAIALGVALTRAFGLVARAVAGLAARSRGLGLVHSLRGLARGAGARDLPFVVLLVAVAAGVFGSVVAGSLQRSQDVAAANRVGADYRIDATSTAGLPSGLDTAGLARIGPTAGLGLAGASLSSRSLASAFVAATVVDPAAYARVVDGTPVDPQLARALGVTAPSTDAGPAVPLILRGSFAARTGLAPGAQLTFTTAGQPMRAVVVAVLADLPGMPSQSNVVVAASALDPRVAATAVPTALLLRAGPDAAPVEAVIGPYRGQLDLQARDTVLRALADAPMPSVMREGFALMLGLASALAGVVVAASLLAALGLRAHEAAVLRSLGVVERSAQRLVVGEAALIIVAALLTGLALGLAVAWLTVPDLGLEQIAGVDAAVVPAVDPIGAAAALAGPVLVGLAALLAGALLARGGSASARLLAEEA